MSIKLRRRYLLLVGAVLLLAGNVVKASCSDYSGTWNVGGISDTENKRYAEEIIQTACKKIEIVKRYLSDQKVVVTKYQLVANDDWVCSKGAQDNLECHKARFTTSGALLLETAVYEEGCLTVSNTHFENDRMISNWDAACPGRKQSGQDVLQRVSHRQNK